MRVLIAGGGTGGHLFPAIALAETFEEKGRAVEILFVGTGNPLESAVLSKKGYDHMSISVEGLKGRGIRRQLRALARIPGAVLEAGDIIGRFSPDIIVGVGGYASGPVALAGRLMGKKVALHEQNLIPGLTNRMLARLAHRIFISFPDRFSVFDARKTVLTGNPLRRDVLSGKGSAKRRGVFTVLVVGGSQGAHAINRAVVDALDHLREPDKVYLIHQTGTRDVEWVTAAYAKQGVESNVVAFIEDMAGAYGQADLVVCRAGATTVAELTALGVPALFIPFPFATNNHQEFNARYVADAGGAEVILEKDLDGSRLAEKIAFYATRPAKLLAMSERSRALGKPEAAGTIVSECMRLVIGH